MGLQMRFYCLYPDYILKNRLKYSMLKGTLERPLNCYRFLIWTNNLKPVSTTAFLAFNLNATGSNHITMGQALTIKNYHFTIHFSYALLITGERTHKPARFVFLKFSKVFPLVSDNNNQRLKPIITYSGIAMTHLPGCLGKTT